MNSAILLRMKGNEKQTLGRLMLYNSRNEVVYQCRTLELPWRYNTPFESCIPDTIGAGRYMLKRRWSKKHKKHLIVEGVPGRTTILIHSGNFYRDTTGCVLVGNDYRDIDGDGIVDVTESKYTLRHLLSAFDALCDDNGTMQLQVISMDGVDRHIPPA